LLRRLSSIYIGIRKRSLRENAPDAPADAGAVYPEKPEKIIIFPYSAENYTFL